MAGPRWGVQPKVWLRGLALLGFAPCVLPLLSIQDDRTRYSLLISAFVSFLGFLATRAVVPLVRSYTLRAGLFGLDINKKGSAAGEKKVPESLGLASGVVFLVSAASYCAAAPGSCAGAQLGRQGGCKEPTCISCAGTTQRCCCTGISTPPACPLRVPGVHRAVPAAAPP